MNFFKTIFLFFVLCSFFANGQIFFSEYAEGTSYNKYLEIYNYSSETVDLDQYAFPSCSNGCDVDEEWDYMNYFPEGATIAAGSVYVITHPNSTNPDGDYYTEEIAIYSNHQFNYLSNGNDVFALIEIQSGLILDIIGEPGPDPGTGWDVAGVTNATKDHTLLRKSSVTNGNNGAWSSSAGTNIDDSEWIVLDNENWDNLGFHNYENNNSDVVGCMCAYADNYDETANIEDGSCVVYGGCSDSSALNYSGDLCLLAEFIDEYCQYEDVYISGCYWCDLAVNYFDFGYQITASNMTLLIQVVDDLVAGDIVGLFYVNPDGFLSCGGAVDFLGDQVLSIAAWGDNPSTAEMDGFQVGDSFIFLILRDGVVYETETTLTQDVQFTNVYTPNGFGMVMEFSVTGEFIEECMLPLGVNQDCDEEIFNILENNTTDKQIYLATDVLGRHISHLNQSGFHFIKYNDGTIQKKYFLNH